MDAERGDEIVPAEATTDFALTEKATSDESEQHDDFEAVSDR